MRKMSVGFVYAFIFGLITAFLYRVPLFGDDLVNTKIFSGGISLVKAFKLVHEQYFGWSSRTLVNFVMYFFESTPKIIFSTVTGVLVCLIVYIINHFVNHRTIFPNFLIVGSAILTFPVIYLYTAGWIATVTTYFYPICFLLIGVWLAQLNLKSNKVNRFIKLIVFICWLYSFNNEQLAVTMLPLICVLIFIQFREHKIGFYLGVASVAILLNLAWMLLSPGNKLRTASDMHFLPTFKYLSFFNKLDMGIVSTIQHYFFGLNLPILIFALSICLVTLSKTTSKRQILLGSTPFLILVFTNTSHLVAIRTCHGNSLFLMNQTGFLTNIHFFWKAAVFQYSISIIWLVISFICLNTLISAKEKVFVFPLLLGGIMSRVMMGFTPTIYASVSRTCTFLTFIFILLAIYLLCNYCTKKLMWIAVMVLLSCFILNVVVTYCALFKGKLLISLWVVWKYVKCP